MTHFSNDAAPITPAGEDDLGRYGRGVGVAALAVAAIGVLLSYQSAGTALDIPFGPRFTTQAGFSLLGVLAVALVTVPLCLVGAGLGLASRARTPDGSGLSALALNSAVAAAVMSLVAVTL